MKLATLTLNQYDRLDQLILSAERGSRKPSGYVIVDNGGSYNIERALTIVQDRVSIDFIRPGKNVGVAAGWNIILEKDLNDPESTGIVISNDDIVLGRDTFALLEDGLKRADFVGCAGGWALFGQTHKCTRRVGWYDENFINAYYEDCDYYLRLHQADIDILDLGWGSGVTHSGEASTKGATPEQSQIISESRTHNYAYFIHKWGSGSPRWGNPHVNNYSEPFNGNIPPGWKDRLSESALPPKDLVAMRWDVVNTIAKSIQAKKYLEIGVENGSMMRRIDIEEKWGVDPVPQITAVQAANVFIPLTSNEFFAKNLSQSLKFDVVFIDGDHRAEQVYQEVQHAISHLSEKGVICLHDCSPYSKQMQEVPLQSGWEWTGDVWKAIAQIRSEGKHLVRVINSDYGVAILLPNVSDDTDELSYLHETRNMFKLSWEDLAAHRTELLGILEPWEWREWLEAKLHVYQAQQ